MLRSNYSGPVQPVIDDLINWDELAGVDLHGFEGMPTEDWTAPVWQRLRDAGKVTKCHAGEFDGAHRVREAIEQLGVTRVQHGVRAIEDREVVQLAVDRGVTFDICPISNVKLQVFPDMLSHPLRALMAAGVNCTISSDDPLIFGNQVSDDYHALATEADYNVHELGQIAKNGWAVADLSATQRDEACCEIDRLVAAHA
jgi:adenosine deaminase